MTLVATIHTPHTIWMLTDRRLSYPDHVKDDACKVMSLETPDGIALLGYAGLGATVLGTEPSDWMSNVLRGRPGKLEDSLLLLGQAIQKQLPTHLVKLPQGVPAVHTVIAPAFVNGKLNAYAIDTHVDRTSGQITQGLGRYTRTIGQNRDAPRLSCIAGSGAAVLSNHINRLAAIKRIATLHDRNKISALAVADELAKLNLFVHEKTSTVGPNCIVAWRYNKEGVHQGGGAHQYYTNDQRDSTCPAIPSIGHGTDLRALADIHMSDIMQWISSRGKGPLIMDLEKVDAELQKLPTDPDELLR
jgi:hypothetical protein